MRGPRLSAGDNSTSRTRRETEDGRCPEDVGHAQDWTLSRERWWIESGGKSVELSPERSYYICNYGKQEDKQGNEIFVLDRLVMMACLEDNQSGTREMIRIVRVDRVNYASRERHALGGR